MNKRVKYKKHNKYGTKIYCSWSGLKNRCNNKNDKKHILYGGRGITYDKKWETFVGFYEDMGSSYIEGLTIDRINVNGNYCKENCRWATRKEQCNNKRNNFYVKLNGEKTTLKMCTEFFGVNYKLVHGRIKTLGWSVEKALGLIEEDYFNN